MKSENRSFSILMADDDEESCMLTQEALREGLIKNPIFFVHDGEELMAYLRKEPPYQDAPVPGLILLDLSMPRKSGREALAEIKSDSKFRTIPVIILTTSRNHQDIHNSYDLGANAYISKPVTFQALVDTMKVIGHYWLELVELPGRDYEP